VSNDVAGVLWLAIAGTIVIFVLMIGVTALPFALVGGGILFAIRRHYNSPAYLEKRSREHTHDLYQSALLVCGRFPDKEEFGKQVYQRLPDGLPDELENDLLVLALDLYDLEMFSELPVPPAVCNSIEGAKYRDFLSAQVSKDTTNAADIAVSCVVECITRFISMLPPLPKEEGIATTPLSQCVPNLGELVETLVINLYRQDVLQFGLFKTVRTQLDKNLHNLSGVSYYDKESSDLIMPSDYEGDDVVDVYLKFTPFKDIFYSPIPFSIPDKARFEHHWILAGTGHGKTQTLQHLLLKDFERVAKGEASVVVIDSQNQLLNNITHLKLFAPGQPLHDKLVWIDPGDVEHPLSLNLFDAKLDRINTYSMRDRERLLNNLVEVYEFVFRSLLSSEMTDRQSTLFQFMTRLMVQILDANILTLVDFLAPSSYDRFAPYIANLDQTARGFFETDYRAGAYKDTQLQIRNRLYSILRSTTFDRMFSANENRVDLFEELSTAKVILINTDKDLLKEGGSSFFGRFFIAMLRQAIEERSQHSKPLPTFLYIDEASEYFDEQFPKMLSTVRKHNIGIVLAYQYLGQKNSTELTAPLISNTSIKFVGGVSPQDANTLASAMNTTAQFIRDQEKGSFAAYVKGTTPTAVSLNIPFFEMEKMEKQSDEEYSALRDMMRAKYATQYEVTPDYTPPKDAHLKRAEAQDPAEEEIKPSDEL